MNIDPQYVVVTLVLGLILTGLFIYLFSIGNRLRKLEKRMKEKE